MTSSQDGGLEGRGRVQADRIFGLDFLRALAIGGVFLSHLHLVFWGGRSPLMALWGTLGVELFFVLSGYLIGGLLLDIAEQRPSVRAYGVFMLRRWMRTLPLYYLWLAVLALCAGLPHTVHWPWYFLTLTQNFAWPMTAPWFQVSWSLMVEEWFYLLFAAVLLGLARMVRIRWALLASCFIFMSVPLVARWMEADSGINWDADIRKIVMLRLDAIAYGVAAIWWVRDRRRYRAVRTMLALAAGIALLGFTAWSCLQSASYESRLWRAGFFCAATTGFALCFPAAIRLKFRSRSVEGIVRWISERSYGIYIVHLEVLELARHAVLSNLVGPRAGIVLAATATLALAALSYRWIEKPILSRRPPQHPCARPVEAMV